MKKPVWLQQARLLMDQYLTLPSDKNCALAILLLTLAIFLLSVALFNFTPVSIAGFLITGLGVLSMCGCIVFFVRYARCVAREEREDSG
jgi:hypothetical protein